MKELRFVQPALPAYRRPFFARLSESLGARVSVHYSRTVMGSITRTSDPCSWAIPIGPVRRLLPGIDWQVGAVSIPIAKGDIVVVSGAPRCLSNLVLLWRASWKGARTVWWGHYWSSTSGNWRLMLRLALMRKADALLSYTDAKVAAYRKRCPSDGRLIAALNNGIDTAPIKKVRAPYVASQRDRTFLFIGRITEKAQLGLVLRAMVQSEANGIVLLVLGEGELAAAMKDEAARLGVVCNVIWHEGTTDETLISAVANRCRAFLYPGEVGLSLIHAMAYGLPALVHNDPVRHMPEIAAFVDGRTGRSFTRGDAVNLAVAMAQMIDSCADLDAMSESSLTSTEASFNTEDMVRRLCDLIEAL